MEFAARIGDKSDLRLALARARSLILDQQPPAVRQPDRSEKFESLPARKIFSFAGRRIHELRVCKSAQSDAPAIGRPREIKVRGGERASGDRFLGGAVRISNQNLEFSELGIIPAAKRKVLAVA